MTDALESLNGLIVPLAGQPLLLPNVAVAELVGYRLSQPANDGPAWFLGWILWRDQRVPLIDPEVLLGQPAAEPPQAPRSLVLNAVGGRAGSSFIAMRVRGIPRSKKIIRGEIDAAGSASEFVSQPVRLADEAETLLIPDLAAIEQALAQAGVLPAE
ncbi:chemotaxis protein CheW [Halopseudomonas bauzanensis]|uniref:Chemosensory pili system protein ChpC n=1 Tax=Halopseudomonas bauzanensis TaxID=653930 RepID=A0A031MCX1_9GAMM|nr:chemotaxis protein CheW [Halopseudomonas bauzanensis]EZQ17906.1 chemotaxis protein [Halopseudomonas bauzanensis]SER91718.1 chemosensory pili system protein ChpC [Halopseudomonas bauzanensis]SFL90175.1 chemosensory pili system protein ChpC [Halopseudomonas bauzanensis]